VSDVKLFVMVAMMFEPFWGIIGRRSSAQNYPNADFYG